MKILNHLTVFVLTVCLGSHIRSDDLLVFDFENQDWMHWQTEGAAFGSGPVKSGTYDIRGFRGDRFVNSFYGGDPATGSLLSHPFKIERDSISFLISGGRHPNETGMELLVGDRSVRTATGNDSGDFRWWSWDVKEFRGEEARLRIFDRHTGGWGHINVDHVIQTNRKRTNASDWRLDEYRKSSDYYTETYRPQFHFSPELNWMNDPNGLVYWDGEYHLFYQHNPHGNSWGHMSWGHAVSRDLVHWKHLPIALHEEYGVMIFSGCCVADKNNTSGFGTTEKPPLVAVYTGHGHGKQTQDLAYSLDNGRHWTKYVGNPVIDLNEANFRDPKVFWHEPTQKWVMVVSLAKAKRLQFYGSANLKEWELLSEFGPAGVENKPNWECPDLFELPIEGEPGTTRWVLEVDMGGGSVAGGSGGEYFTGEFDGTTFVADSEESQWVDFGRDFYAPVSWSNVPKDDGRRIWIGWMNNWETNLIPTSPWRSSMSIPRSLTLRPIDGKLRLIQTPVHELQALRASTIKRSEFAIEGLQTIDLGKIDGQRLEVVAEFEPNSATEFGFQIACATQEKTVVGYRTSGNELFVDRTESGEDSFHPNFPGVHSAPMSIRGGRVRLHIFVDESSVEVFGNDGEVVITDRIFPDPGNHELRIYSAGGSAGCQSLQIWQLKSIWKSELQ